MMVDLPAEVTKIKQHIDQVRIEKRVRLKDVDFFCLDNSLRESTVGQLRSHTLKNKIDIMKEVRSCNIKDMIVASFNNGTRVDDDFVRYLRAVGEDFSDFYSFSEVFAQGPKNGVYDATEIPAGLRKNKEFKLRNNFFELDLADANCDWGGKYTVADVCKALKDRIDYVYNEISPQAKILLNFRDFPFCMSTHPERLLTVAKFLSQLPQDRGMFALCFEDPFGEYLPEELEAWTASLRRVMTGSGLLDGKILVHIHQKWDLQTASQLDCISAGADGVWASLCEEGAALGHACSSITMMNLIRLGNTKVQTKYKCTNLRKAAIAVTKLTTGQVPHPKTVIYGERSADLVFGFLGIGDFDVAAFFGFEAPNRITSLVTTDMLQERLTNIFGTQPQFNDPKILQSMKDQILLDLRSGIKEEYHSPCGLAMLFDRSGGKLVPAMAEVIAATKLRAVHHDNLIAEIKQDWDLWDIKEPGQGQGDGCLTFDSFYHGFMAPYFGCYACPKTKDALKAIDMDTDGLVDWKEFLTYIKWALRQYPDTEDPDVLLSIVFEKGLIPAAMDAQKLAKY